MSEHVVSEVIDGQAVSYDVPKDEWEFHTKHVPEMTARHLGGQLGLALTPYRPISQPDQRLAVTHSDASPFANLATIRMLGNRVIGEQRVLEFIDAYTARPDLRDARRMDADLGLNTGIITNHLLLHDVAVIPGLELLALGQERFIPRSATVMSKAITRLEVDAGDFGIIPATEALGLTGGKYYSVPRTKSSYLVKVGSSIADAVNPHMLASLDERITEGGLRLTMAPSGSTDRIEDGTITMQHVNSKTAATLAKLDRILLVAVNLDAPLGTPWFKIGRYTDKLRNNPGAIHDLMKENADNLAEITGMNVEYEEQPFYETEEYKQAKEAIKGAAHKAGERLSQARQRVREDMQRHRQKRGRL
jgi:hypothetical protein